MTRMQLLINTNLFYYKCVLKTCELENDYIDI